MDREDGEFQFLGFLGIFKESFIIISSWTKIFTQITIAMILPLSLIYLGHIQISHILFSEIMFHEYILHRIPKGTHSYDKTSDTLSSELTAFILFKIGYFIFFLVLALISTSAVVYTTASIYTGNEINLKKVIKVVPKVWKRLMVTFIWNSLIVFAYNVVSILIFFLSALLFGSIQFVGPIFLFCLAVIYLSGFVYISIIWHLASVVSVLEEFCGLNAMTKSQGLIRGTTGISASTFLVLGLIFFGIQQGFEYYVVLGFGGGVASRILYGILFVVLICVLFLFGLVIQTVIYFVCKSYHHERIDKPSLADHLGGYLGDYVPLKAKERRALEEFRKLIQEALNKRLFSSSTPLETSSSHEEVSIWGVPLLKDDRSDVILLKFLRARDFKVNESFTMLKNTIQWRRSFNVDELIKEDLGDDLEMVVFMRGQDKEGHPVCYNVYGEFQNKELYAKTFADEEKRRKFLRWRVQFLERSLRKLDFNPGGVNTIFQVSDLKNSPGPGKRELRIATKQALQILQDNYPEVVAKQVFINVPWWHLAFYTMISPFLTQRTKSKFVFAGPSKTAETLLKYISPEQLPIQYGGLSVDFCECNPVFTIDDPLTEITVKPATKQTVEIIVNEKCTIFWELRVVNWEVSYGAEYVPDEHGYSVIIQKTKKMAPTDEPVMSNSFQISKLGKILLTVDNPTAKKKKLLYRFKVMPYED